MVLLRFYMLEPLLHNIVFSTEAFAGAGVKNMFCSSAEAVKEPAKKLFGESQEQNHTVFQASFSAQLLLVAV